jgi:hypothetical protein
VRYAEKRQRCGTKQLTVVYCPTLRLADKETPPESKLCRAETRVAA